MPNSTPDISFSHDHIALSDGAVVFKCSTDIEKWPWLKLHPANNIVVQMVNYWCSVEAARARSAWDPDKWSALTHCSWTTFTTGPDAGHATHGVAMAAVDPQSPNFNMMFFGADGAPVYKLSGAGVIFHTRDFEAWRKEAKAKAALLAGSETFSPAAPEKLGVETPIECLVSDILERDGTQCVEALVTKENGFVPGHPYHGGSGDHVNSGHLLDAAQQAVRILCGSQMEVCTGGEATFKRYVELGYPFCISVAAPLADNEVSLTLKQGGKICAEVTMKFLDNDE